MGHFQTPNKGKTVYYTGKFALLGDNRAGVPVGIGHQRKGTQKGGKGAGQRKQERSARWRVPLFTLREKPCLPGKRLPLGTMGKSLFKLGKKKN